MSTPPPGFIRTPTPLAAALIALSVLPLPSGSRDRWSDEYRAEIFDLSRSRQILEAASALSGSFALRSALSADPEAVRPHDEPVLPNRAAPLPDRQRGQPGEPQVPISRMRELREVQGRPDRRLPPDGAVLPGRRRRYLLAARPHSPVQWTQRRLSTRRVAGPRPGLAATQAHWRCRVPRSHRG